MEWVETTGRTVEEAKEAALDKLGVAEDDAEFDVVEEPKSGLFGRLRQEARVRARVQPARPRPKIERRERRRRGGSREEGRVGDGGEPSPGPSDGEPADGGARSSPAALDTATRAVPEPTMTTSEREERLRSFLDGLISAFGLDGRTEVEHVDEVTLEGRVLGDSLGPLIGPRGQTLAAVQELARSAVLRGAGRGIRLRVDVGGYQARRRQALERFTRGVAEQVLSTGTAVSMEPMPPPDRKVVHDTVNAIDGVTTRSEGDEPDRRVLIFPEEAPASS